jgi:hypothetical protein
MWMRSSLLGLVVLVLCGCGGESMESREVGEVSSGLLLSRSATNTTPLPCPDPAVFSEKNQGQVHYVYCTGLGRVWRTTDWNTFTDVRPSVSFNVGEMPAASQQLSKWWAPAVAYDAPRDRYILWVSVIDGQNFAKETRSLAVFVSDTPTGPWIYRRTEKDATAGGQMYIDPSFFRNSDGTYYLYWKQYGGGLLSSIMGAKLDAYGTNIVDGTEVEIIDGWGAAGAWEGNCRENPTVWQNASTGRWHMLFSGNAWFSGAYATGHAVSSCGPLCGFTLKPTTDRGIPQVVQTKNLSAFSNGGPGGADWQGTAGTHIVYAAAHRSNQGDETRYLFRERVQWDSGNAPFVNQADHNPYGF